MCGAPAESRISCSHRDIRLRKLDCRVTLIERCTEAGHLTHRRRGRAHIGPTTSPIHDRTRGHHAEHLLDPPDIEKRTAATTVGEVARHGRPVPAGRHRRRAAFPRQKPQLHPFPLRRTSQLGAHDRSSVACPGRWIRRGVPGLLERPALEAREVLDIPLASVDEQSTLAAPQPVGDGSSASTPMKPPCSTPRPGRKTRPGSRPTGPTAPSWRARSATSPTARGAPVNPDAADTPAS